MLIILVRHAEREYRENRADSEQILTEKGRRQAARLGENIAARLEAQNQTVSIVLSSNFARASQTAQLIAPCFGLTIDKIKLLPTLQPEPDGSVAESIAPVLEAAANGVAVVGHGPDLAELCEQLSRQAIELKKAHALAIEWDVETSNGKILWTLSHKD